MVEPVPVRAPSSSEEARAVLRSLTRRLSPDLCLMAAVLCVSCVVGWLWLTTIPFQRAPDEAAHFQVVRFIREQARLPVFKPDEMYLLRTPSGVVETYSAFPPLAYLLGALATAAMPMDSFWPSRLVSFLSYLGTIALTFMVARGLAPSDRWLAASAALVVGLLPQVAFTGAYTNNDALAAFLSALLCYLLIRASRTQGTGVFLAVGLTVGAILITKYTAYGVAGVGAGVALLIAMRARDRPGRGLALLGGVVASSGWWFVRNWQLYRELVPSSVIASAKEMAGGNSLFVPEDHGITLLTLSTMTSFWELTLKSFVGAFGYLSVYLHPLHYAACALLAIIAALGLIRRLARGGFSRESGLVALIGLAMIGATVLVAMVVNVYGEFSPQGRYLFAALLPFAVGSLAGWRWAAWGVPWRLWAPIPVGALLALNLISLFHYLVPRYYNDAPQQALLAVDRPSQPVSKDRGVVVAGWALTEGTSAWRPLDPENVSGFRRPARGVTVRLRTDEGGRSLGEARYGFERPDARGFYGGVPQLGATGFWLEIPPGSLPVGKHRISVCVDGDSRPAILCQDRAVEVVD